MLNWLRRFTRNEPEPAKIYIYLIDYEHDRTYAENIVQYLESRGVLCRIIPLRADGFGPNCNYALMITQPPSWASIPFWIIHG